MALSAVWTIFGAATLIIGLRRSATSVRIGALMLLGLATIKVALVDLRYFDAGGHTLLLNPTFASFALLIVAFAVCVWFYARAEGLQDYERSFVMPVLVCVANVLAVVILSAEAIGYFHRARSVIDSQIANLRLAQQLSISVVWAIYGGVMLAVGIARRSKLLRVMALALLGLTIFKVFLFDLSSLDKLYRIISFIVLGLILMAVSFLYQRYRQRVAEFIGDAEAPASAGTE